MTKPASTLQAAPVGTKARFTTGEFLQMAGAGAFEDMKVELTDGELERMPPPMSNHGQRQSEVMPAPFRVLAEAAERVRAESGINFGNDTVVASDVAIVLA